MVRAELPLQVVAADKTAQARVERPDVVILEVDLDEGLPVVVALVHMHLVEHIAGEVQVGLGSHLAQFRRDVAAVVLEHHAVPGAGVVAVQVQAGVVVEQRCAQQLTL